MNVHLRSSSVVFAAYVLVAPLGLRGQTNGTVVIAAGYSQPTVSLAPGQVVTLFVSGFGSTLARRGTAAGSPLPTKLAGMSVLLEQSEFPAGSPPPQPGGLDQIPVPLLSVSTFADCANKPSPPCAVLIGITTQLPFELVPISPFSLAPGIARLVISEDGTVVGNVNILPSADQIHILRNCDTVLASGCTMRLPVAMVTHGDGTLVTVAHPASGGEVLVMYASGLWIGDSHPVTGTAPTAPIPVPRPGMVFDFRPNAPPTSASFPGSNPAIRFAGLIPGGIGLYQINFQLPPVPPGTPACGDPVLSNVTVSISEGYSFDGAGICVSPE